MQSIIAESLAESFRPPALCLYPARLHPASVHFATCLATEAAERTAERITLVAARSLRPRGGEVRGWRPMARQRKRMS